MPYKSEKMLSAWRDKAGLQWPKAFPAVRGIVFERDANEPQGDAGTEASLDAFLFLGASLFFPGSLLRIVEQEAGCANAMRLDELRGLPEALVARNRQVRKVFFEDRVAAEVMRNFLEYRAIFPKADWILAYRDLAAARALLDARAQAPELSGILLLPMTLPIYLWTSMLRLVLAGQFIAEGDLIAASLPREGNDRTQMQGATSSGRAGHLKGKGRQEEGLRLTQREKEVLALVSQGGRNKSIANAMCLSEHTVKLHLHNAITKIGARNRTEAATWYLSHHSGDPQ